MTINQELIDRYTNEVSNVDWFEVIVLSHSQFLLGGKYLIHNAATEVNIYAQYGGATELFYALPFELSLPTRDSEGRGDLQISIAVPQSTIIEQLQVALANPLEPIIFEYSAFLFSNTSVPLYDPYLKFVLTNATATENAIAGIARMSDTINKPFPDGIYRGVSFPGLIRR